jgi:succinate dehydrogenase / fumarate reductase cytochrome b subunit
LFYHLCNGIRHLVWDAGYCLDIEAVYLSGKIMVSSAIGLTILAWVVALAVAG